jgi:APA family basic amino acid/polyamine antiporter
MVVAETIGVGIFLTPATMVRTLGSAERVLVVWAVMALLTVSGALCYAELSTRYPRAGGMYVYLREAFGRRCAFVYGWMALLVMDPGLTAALGIGGAQYVLAAAGASADALVPTAVALILGFGGLTLMGVSVSARILRWTSLAKLVAVGVLVLAAVIGSDVTAAAAGSLPPLGIENIAPAVIAAFFAFGGWWDLGRMAEEVDRPRYVMPRALIGGVSLVAVAYVLTSVAVVLRAQGVPAADSDAELVNQVGAALFGPAAARALAVIVVIAVAGSLAAVLLGAPRVYLAMARDGLLPRALIRFDDRRGTVVGATVIQITLACGLVLIGTFDEILGYFVPGAIFFLGLSAFGLLRLPRLDRSEQSVFQLPWSPVPVLLFVALIVGMLVIFATGQPRETAIGAAVIALGIPVSYLHRGTRVF